VKVPYGLAFPLGDAMALHVSVFREVSSFAFIERGLSLREIPPRLQELRSLCR
jgi:hypothetical protein